MGVRSVVKEVVVCSNGMVMVYDAKGEQMPEYQGPIGVVLESALEALDQTGSCWLEEWGSGRIRTTRIQLKRFLENMKKGR